MTRTHPIRAVSLPSFQRACQTVHQVISLCYLFTARPIPLQIAIGHCKMQPFGTARPLPDAPHGLRETVPCGKRPQRVSATRIAVASATFREAVRARMGDPAATPTAAGTAPRRPSSPPSSPPRRADCKTQHPFAPHDGSRVWSAHPRGFPVRRRTGKPHRPLQRAQKKAGRSRPSGGFDFPTLRLLRRGPALRRRFPRNGIRIRGGSG